MKLFYEKPFHIYEEGRIKELKDTINSNSDFSEPLESEAEGFAEDFRVEHLTFDKSDYQKDITMERLPINMNKGEMSIDGYKTVAFVNYSLKVNWDEKQRQLAYYYPTRSNQQQLNIKYLEYPMVIKFSIETTYSVPELPEHIIDIAVKDRDEVFANLQSTLDFINQDIDRFNGKLFQIALETIQERKRYVESMAAIKSKL